MCELQVEDYRNASMIECKMGISADSLVLIHSSSKVSDQEPLCVLWFDFTLLCNYSV